MFWKEGEGWNLSIWEFSGKTIFLFLLMWGYHHLEEWGRAAAFSRWVCSWFNTCAKVYSGTYPDTLFYSQLCLLIETVRKSKQHIPKKILFLFGWLFSQSFSQQIICSDYSLALKWWHQTASTCCFTMGHVKGRSLANTPGLHHFIANIETANLLLLHQVLAPGARRCRGGFSPPLPFLSRIFASLWDHGQAMGDGNSKAKHCERSS